MPSEKPKIAKKIQIKIVVRRLPHGISQEELLQQLEPIPEHKLFWFCKADINLIPFAFSRAYFVFLREEDAIAFVDRFNGYVFVDKLGHESTAIVELAPYPEIIDNTKSAKENDKRVNTIEEDAEYIRFLKEYNCAVSKKPSTVDELLNELEEKQKRLKAGFVQRTPLTDFVLEKNWQKKQDRRPNRFNKEKELQEKKDIPKKTKKENKKERIKKEKLDIKKEGEAKKVFTSILKNSKKTDEDNDEDHVGKPMENLKIFEEQQKRVSEKSLTNDSNLEKKFLPFKIVAKNREVLQTTEQPTSASSPAIVTEKGEEDIKEHSDRKLRDKGSVDDNEKFNRSIVHRNKKPERAIYKPPSHRPRTKLPDKIISGSKASQRKDENVDI